MYTSLVVMQRIMKVVENTVYHLSLFVIDIVGLMHCLKTILKTRTGVRSQCNDVNSVFFIYFGYTLCTACTVPSFDTLQHLLLQCAKVQGQSCLYSLNMRKI